MAALRVGVPGYHPADERITLSGAPATRAAVICATRIECDGGESEPQPRVREASGVYCPGLLAPCDLSGAMRGPVPARPPPRRPRDDPATHDEDPLPTMFDRLLGLFSRDIGIDLGTANTLVHVRDRGIVMSEPSVVAIDAKTRRVLAIGAEAKRMVGRTPANIIAVRPLRDGVISDFDVTEQMIKYFVNRVHDRIGLIPRPRMLLGIPSGVTEVEKRAVRDAAMNAGARWARLIEEPMAAAIGAGLPVSEPSGSLIVDIGGGTTEVAVISLGGIVVSRSIRIGGDEMDQDIVTFARREYNLFLGERTAEDIKIAIGSAYPGDWDAQRVTLRGRDLLTGLPRSVEVGADQIREAIEPSVAQIVDTVKDTIEETPPELVADIMDQGVVLAGGGALLAGLDRRVAEATQMPVHIADDPLTCVARGTGIVLQELDAMNRVLVSETYARPPR